MAALPKMRYSGSHRQKKTVVGKTFGQESQETQSEPLVPADYTVEVPIKHFTSGKRGMTESRTTIKAVMSPPKKPRHSSHRCELRPMEYDWDDIGGTIQEDAYHAPIFFSSNFDDSGVEPAYTSNRADLHTSSDDREKYKRPEHNPMRIWRHHDRHTFLQEMIRLDGRGDAAGLNCSCGALAGFRCRDCSGDVMFCQECTVSMHSRLPFHRIEEWKDNYFATTSLKCLGLRVQLGHPPAERCPKAKAAFDDDFVVIDTNGIHEVGLDFCCCHTASSETVQLLRGRLYPATTTITRTAATFNAMTLFQALNFESKTSSYEFQSTMAALTDNSGATLPRDCYDQLRLMLRTWMNTKLLKRGGRGHEESGIAGTKDGELALRCPACPQPGRNLPSAWHMVAVAWAWLFSMFIAIDANFKTKRKKVSSAEKDPSLSAGYAYFVDETKYSDHLREYRDMKQERSNCVNHSAVNNAEVGHKDLAITGTVTCDCARHDMKRPNACGSLTAGERYLNTDAAFLFSMQHEPVLRFVVSYDIVCQWSRNLWKRLEKYCATIDVINDNMTFVFLVPKFHLPAHIEACNILYSFHLRPSVAMTDAEGCERTWANINGVAPQAKEMGPGYWQDTMNNHYGSWNWKKITRLGPNLLNKFEKALPQRLEHLTEFRDFEESIGDKELVQTWQRDVEAWERNSAETNPYQRTSKDPTLHQIRQKMALDEAAKADAEELRGIDLTAGGARLSPSEFIAQGLQLEEDQHRIKSERKNLGEHATSKQLADFQLTLNKLQSRIDAFLEAQSVVMPEVSLLRSHSQSIRPSDTPPLQSYAIPLWLPSSVMSNASRPPQERRGAPAVSCSAELMETEWELRKGQAFDALHDLRNALRIRAHNYKIKDRYSSGSVRSTSQINRTIAKVQDRVNVNAAIYRRALTAMNSLPSAAQVTGWNTRLKELRDEDVRGMTEGLLGESTGKKTTSWIWMVEGITANIDDDPGLNEAFRIEWCRMRARAMRWSEEVELVPEEMRRTLMYFSWEIGTWKDRATEADAREGLEPTQKEGLVAYAMRQASLRQALQNRFKKLWSSVPSLLVSNYTAIAHSKDIGKEGWTEEQCRVPFSGNFIKELTA